MAGDAYASFIVISWDQNKWNLHLKVVNFRIKFLNLVHCEWAYIEIRLNNGTFITVAGCWHSMIVVGIVAHTQEFFDKRLNLPNWPKYFGYLRKTSIGCPQSVSQHKFATTWARIEYVLSLKYIANIVKRKCKLNGWRCVRFFYCNIMRSK